MKKLATKRVAKYTRGQVAVWCKLVYVRVLSQIGDTCHIGWYSGLDEIVVAGRTVPAEVHTTFTDVLNLRPLTKTERGGK